jgi:hypothetical protein
MKRRLELEAEVHALRAMLEDMDRHAHSRFEITFSGTFDDLMEEQKAALVAARTEHVALLERRHDVQFRLARLLEAERDLDNFVAEQAQILKHAKLPRVVRPPGARLGHALSILLTRRAYEKAVAPVIADAQHEYLEAVGAGHNLHARWIAVRLHFIVWPGWVYGLFASLVRRIIGAGTGG